MTATKIGIEGFNAMDKPLVLQKLECPVNGHWRCALLRCLNAIQQVIGFYSLMALPYQLKNLAPHRCEASASGRAELFRALYCG
jgi:hypothetical protein